MLGIWLLLYFLVPIVVTITAFVFLSFIDKKYRHLGIQQVIVFCLKTWFPALIFKMIVERFYDYLDTQGSGSPFFISIPRYVIALLFYFVISYIVFRILKNKNYFKIVLTIAIILMLTYRYENWVTSILWDRSDNFFTNPNSIYIGLFRRFGPYLILLIAIFICKTPVKKSWLQKEFRSDVLDDIN